MPDLHVLDLYRIDLAGGKDADPAAQLAATGRSGLDAIGPETLSGKTATRQKLQLEYTAQNREFIDPQLPQILSSRAYPLHFIDFGPSRLAIPYHVNMPPYEIAAFQWSCHTIRAAGAEVEHSEWLNTVEAFPNFEFATALKNQIGDKGTVYIWSHHERDVLREIRHQMDTYGHNDPALAKWLDALTARDNPRVVDLYELARVGKRLLFPSRHEEQPCHQARPACGLGSKRNSPHPSCVFKYVKNDGGHLLDPYTVLPPLPIAEKCPNNHIVRLNSSGNWVTLPTVGFDQKPSGVLPCERYPN